MDMRGRWKRKTLAERFMERVMPEPNSGCWLWTGRTHPRGYGLTNTHGERIESSHRVSFQIHRGPVPEGFSVCHRCDVRCCVNPDHLFLGTQAQNMHDKQIKGRAGKSALDADAVRLIRNTGAQTKELAARFGVTTASIKNVRKGKTWSHVV